MEDGKIHNFDLPALLKLGDLDIRKIAENDSEMLAKKYFALLSHFVDFAPRVQDALTKIAALQTDKSLYQILVAVKTMLANLGYNKLVPVIGAILEANEKGNTEYAAQCAKRLLGDFNKFYTRIISATKTVNLSDIQIDDDDSTYSNYSAWFGEQTLIKILEKTDAEEATRKLRILAVDDTPVMLKKITHALNEEYKVFTVSDPTKVEEFLRQITPDLFLLDYKMPEMNGFELIQVIKKFEEHKDTPIIFLTSTGTNDNVAVAAMLGVCDYIVKPFKEAVLREKIAKHIVKKKSF